MCKLLMYFLFVLLFLSAVTCNDQLVETKIGVDTTSHNFSVVRIDTIGDLFSTVYTVDVDNENSIWIGGEFTKKDTISSNYLFSNNLANWNGNNWSMHGVKFLEWGTSGSKNLQQVRMIKAFDDSTIFIYSEADNYAIWNRSEWSTNNAPSGTAQRLWARNKNQIFLVGFFGNAKLFNGNTFIKMYTGLTNPPLLDIWGDDDNVYTVGTATDLTNEGKERVILYSQNSIDWRIVDRYNFNDTTPTAPNIFLGEVKSIYRTNRNSKLWVLGGVNHGSLYQITSLSPFSAIEFFTIPTVFYPKYIRGNGDNDLFLVGELDGKLYHYNGRTWQLISLVNNFLLHDISINGNIIILVGETRGDRVTKGIVVMLKR